mmetsp:Transcript_27642/g.64351  ORF Transcript_27642/g.64351 Transcript_27642/m.64351 type:complete len:231 (+) Transcript_27642:725-1417(+)
MKACTPGRQLESSAEEPVSGGAVCCLTHPPAGAWTDIGLPIKLSQEFSLHMATLSSSLPMKEVLDFSTEVSSSCANCLRMAFSCVSLSATLPSASTRLPSSAASCCCSKQSCSSMSRALDCTSCRFESSPLSSCCSSQICESLSSICFMVARSAGFSLPFCCSAALRSFSRILVWTCCRSASSSANRRWSSLTSPCILAACSFTSKCSSSSSTSFRFMSRTSDSLAAIIS